MMADDNKMFLITGPCNVSETGVTASWYEQVNHCVDMGGYMLDSSFYTTENLANCFHNLPIEYNKTYWIRGTSLRWVWNQRGKEIKYN